MSDPSPPAATASRRTVAAVHKGVWPGWIWAVPLAALAIVVWLVIRAISTRGVAVTVWFDNAAQMKPDATQVFYRGLEVGKVSDVALSKDGTKAIAHIRIRSDYKKYLNAGTRFYLIGAQPSLSDPASLKAIVAGPTLSMVPGAGSPARDFLGISGEVPERLAVALPYRVMFDGPVGELKVGAAVTLRGFTVGEVARIELTIDPAAGSIATGVTMLLDPTRFQIEGAAPAAGNWTPIMNATLSALVQHQLRARLTQSPPLVGGRQIELATVPDAPPAMLKMEGRVPEIPAAGTSGIGELMQAAGELPVREIGDNVRAITGRVKQLVSSPRIDDSVAHLDGALAQLDRTLQEAGPKVAPTLQSVHDTVDALRQTARELDATVSQVQEVIGANPAAPDGSLQPTLLHLSQAARSVRVLADYLDQHPESLVRGR
ncbi:MAG TPA: MlaD family protein [Steroidobacteraceae bacterium]